MWQSSLYDNKPKIPGKNGPQDNIESQHVFILLHSQNFTIPLLSFIRYICIYVATRKSFIEFNDAF